jgi:hypothetical protein
VAMGSKGYAALARFAARLFLVQRQRRIARTLEKLFRFPNQRLFALMLALFSLSVASAQRGKGAGAGRAGATGVKAGGGSHGGVAGGETSRRGVAVGGASRTGETVGETSRRGIAVFSAWASGETPVSAKAVGGHANVADSFMCRTLALPARTSKRGYREGDSIGRASKAAGVSSASSASYSASMAATPAAMSGRASRNSQSARDFEASRDSSRDVVESLNSVNRP